MVNIAKDKRIKLELTLLGMVLISIAIGFFLITAFHRTPIITENLHLAIEFFLALSSLLTAYLLLSRAEDAHDIVSLPLAAGFLFMGILGFFHALMGPSNLLYRMGYLGGGLSFALILLPGKAKITGIIRKNLIGITLTVSALLLVWTFYFKNTLPPMLQQRTFMPIAMRINFLGSIFYLAAAGKLLILYHRQMKTEFYLFGGVSIFLSLSGVMSLVSSLWEAEWWYWHFLRLAAYCFGLAYLIFEHSRLVDNLKSSLAVNLENQYSLSIRNRIADVFLTVPDEQMYASVLDVILKASRSRYGLFGYVDEDGAMVYPSLTKDIWDKCQMEDKKIVFPRSTWGGIWGRAIIEKKSLYSNKPYHVPSGHIPVGRSLVVPILYQDNLIGMFHVANKETNYTEDDVKLLEALAGYTAPILNARLQRDRQEQARRLAEQNLREERDKTRKYLDIAGVMIVVLNADQTVVLINKKGCEILGYGENEIIGKNWLDNFLPQRLKSQVKIVFGKLIAGEIAPVKYYENPVLRKDGQERIIAWHNTVIRDEAGKILATLGSGEDITERRQAEAELDATRAQLLHAEKLSALGKLVATIAHEFKNPLFGIKMILQEIESDGNLNENLRKHNNLAIEEIDRLFRMLQNLKDFYRPSEGEVTSLNVNHLIEDVLEISQKELILNGIHVITTFSEDIPPIPVIADQIKQVFLNLVNNADDAMQQSGGCLTIETKMEGNKVKIIFRDEGTGISQENMKKIFDPFFTTKPAKGTGLGLAVSCEIIKKHGGGILVESVPNRGSVFTVELPCPVQRKTFLKAG